MKAEKILTSKNKFHIELGLTRIKRILEILGNPETKLNCIHVAGTNGKGSVCAILENILIKEGLKTAKFTSPHLFSYTERISINGIPITQGEFDALVNKITNLDKKNGIELTEFEILTAAAFDYFANAKVDIVILEVGLGGRLDSTNVIKKPLVSAITSISLDHTLRLGNTIEKIAFEKAGIIKKDCPCVFLKSNKGYDVLLAYAKGIGAKVVTESYKETGVGAGVEICSKQGLNGDFAGSYAIISGEKFEFGLNGKFQSENLSLALNALKALPFKVASVSIKEGLKDVKWKFRMEYDKKKKILVDACHNPDGARVLREFLDENFKGKKIKLIYGTLNNKDYNSILQHLEGCISELCFYEFDYPNALKFDELPPEFKLRARKINNPIVEIEKRDYDLTVVAGSIYMLGKIFL